MENKKLKVDKSKEVDAKEVLEFIKAKEAETKLPEEDGNRLVELTEARESEFVIKDEDEQRVDVPSDTLYTPDVHTRDSILEWAKSYIPLEDLELTETEKLEFLRSALNDTQYTLAIPVLKEHVVHCRALTDYEIEIMYAALEQDRKNELIQTDADFFSRMQNYGVLLQVMAIDTTTVPFIQFKKPESVVDEFSMLNTNVNKLREAALNINANAARAALLRAALRIFAAKLKLALENIANADFWEPAAVD